MIMIKYMLIQAFNSTHTKYHKNYKPVMSYEQYNARRLLFGAPYSLSISTFHRQTENEF